MSLTLRPIGDGDASFLYRVYASTRADEMALLDWSEADKDAFLRGQFEAQHADYSAHYTEAVFDLIVLDDEPIGRLYLDRRADEIRIIDIALLPEHRGSGIGSRLLDDILTEALGVGLPVRIHVERFNRALGLYERLGFRHIEDQGVYYLMEWSPDTPDTGTGG